MLASFYVVQLSQINQNYINQNYIKINSSYYYCILYLFQYRHLVSSVEYDIDNEV